MLVFRQALLPPEVIMKELNHLQACIASAAEVCGSKWMIA
jgi:hypothetical protein